MALIDGHYILNEDVKGVSTFYLKNYDDIEDKCKDKEPADKFKISAKNKNYVQNKARYNEVKSYEFVKFMTSDQKPWSFDELNQLKINTYDLFDSSDSSDEILSEDDFSDEDDFDDYLNSLDIKDYYKYLTKIKDEDNYDINKVLETYDLNDSSENLESED